uniref:MARVEL domain-containing protein n=1 Tax=Syphacia muris TaxID=451379 RepID=A0A0N5AS29_9BILA
MQNRWGRSRPIRNLDRNENPPDYFSRPIYFDESQSRYRCLCSCFHIKTGALFVAVTELIILVFFFVNSLLIQLTHDSRYQKSAGLDDTYVTIPFIASIVGICLSVLVIFVLFVGLLRNHPLLLIPHITVQVLVILLLLLVIVGGSVAFVTDLTVFYRLMNAAPFKEHPSSNTVALDIETAARFYFIFILYCICFLLQIWFLIIIYNCYRYLDERQSYMRYCMAYSTPMKTLTAR